MIDNQTLNVLLKNRGISPEYPPYAGAASLLIHPITGLPVLDPLNPSSPVTLYNKFSLAQIAALTGTSGNIGAFVLPRRSVVLSTTVKHNTLIQGGKATSVLTSDNTNPTAGQVVVINGVTYTIVATVAANGDVKRGASSDATMLNLLRAINNSGGTPGAGNDYMVAAAHPDVTGPAVLTGHTFTLTAVLNGSAGNAITTTTNATGWSWTGATFAGGGAKVSAATARLVSAQNNYGTAFDVLQAAGAEVFDFYGTPKSELMGGPSTINLAMTCAGTTLDLVTQGEIEAWLTFFVRPVP